MTQSQSLPSKLPQALRPPTFECSRIDDADTVLIVVSGELDIATVAQLDHALRDAESVAPQIVLDLGGLEFMASCGARLLIEADARIRRAGGRLEIERAPEGLHWMIALICASAEFPHDALTTTSTHQPGCEQAAQRGDAVGSGARSRIPSLPSPR